MALFSYLTPKDQVSPRVVDEKGSLSLPFAPGRVFTNAERPLAPAITTPPTTSVPLIQLAWARSGDKGDTANVGVIARQARFLPYIWAALDEACIAQVFSHFLLGDVTRYLMPGANAMNILMTQVLGGGGAASIRNDPQGKGYSQILLTQEIAVPEGLV